MRFVEIHKHKNLATGDKLYIPIMSFRNGDKRETRITRLGFRRKRDAQVYASRILARYRRLRDAQLAQMSKVSAL